ncbi:MAG: hypothetical protein J7M39_01550 [Anaerolineae bacterium]|nr:hypothetical protein [Anaerolineae bacterium]
MMTFRLTQLGTIPVGAFADRSDAPVALGVLSAICAGHCPDLGDAAPDEQAEVIRGSGKTADAR